MDTEKFDRNEIVELTAEIVSAYLSNNHVAVTDLPALIASIHNYLDSLNEPAATPVPEQVAFVPAVSVKKSITRDYIICLEDGKHFKSMKRHLATKFGMTPEDYRRKWNLPANYPMVAQAYATKRSELALSLGLGRKKKSDPSPEPVAAKKPARAKKVAADA